MSVTQSRVPALLCPFSPHPRPPRPLPPRSLPRPAAAPLLPALPCAPPGRAVPPRSSRVNAARFISPGPAQPPRRDPAVRGRGGWWRGRGCQGCVPPPCLAAVNCQRHPMGHFCLCRNSRCGRFGRAVDKTVIKPEVQTLRAGAGNAWRGGEALHAPTQHSGEKVPSSSVGRGVPCPVPRGAAPAPRGELAGARCGQAASPEQCESGNTAQHFTSPKCRFPRCFWIHLQLVLPVSLMLPLVSAPF